MTTCGAILPERHAVWIVNWGFCRLLRHPAVAGSNPVASTDAMRSCLVAAAREIALARKSPPENDRGRLDEAIATLIENQAALLARVAETDRDHVEFQRQYLEFERRHFEFERETAERFARIEAQMAEILRVLNDHGRMLERLPEAVRDKIGFHRQ
jgi:hypothetical protein